MILSMWMPVIWALVLLMLPPITTVHSEKLEADVESRTEGKRLPERGEPSILESFAVGCVKACEKLERGKSHFTPELCPTPAVLKAQSVSILQAETHSAVEEEGIRLFAKFNAWLVNTLLCRYLALVLVSVDVWRRSLSTMSQLEKLHLRQSVGMFYALQCPLLN